LPNACKIEVSRGQKDLFHYFKHDSQTSLPKSISQSTVDVVNRYVSRISSSQSDEAPKTDFNVHKSVDVLKMV